MECIGDAAYLFWSCAENRDENSKNCKQEASAVFDFLYFPLIARLHFCLGLAPLDCTSEQKQICIYRGRQGRRFLPLLLSKEETGLNMFVLQVGPEKSFSVRTSQLQDKVYYREASALSFSLSSEWYITCKSSSRTPFPFHLSRYFQRQNWALGRKAGMVQDGALK